MARTARVVVAGVPHHVTQRGNNRDSVFLEDADRIRYLTILGRESRAYGLRILGYCFMTNHVHLVVVPETVEAIAKGLGRTSYGYTRTFHARWGGCGHLWQQRWRSCPMDEGYLTAAMVYVELNPVRAGMLRNPGEYLWSSARAHVRGRDRSGLLDMAWWRVSGLAEDWPSRLQAGVAENIVGRLRKATDEGSPLGDANFVREVERLTGRRFGGDSHK